MRFTKLTEKKWYNGAVIVCIGVVLYVALTHLNVILSVLGTFIGYFKPVIAGIVFAYMISPLAKFFYYRVFRKMKLGKSRWYLSVAIAFLLMLLMLAVLMGMLIPQIIQSLAMFSSNFEGYARSLINWIDSSPLQALVNRESMEALAGTAMSSISDFVRENSGRFLSIAASSGKGIISAVISLILAVYLLIDSRRISAVVREFISLTMSQDAYEAVLDFVLRCDTILVSYIVQSLLESLIVGIACAILMAFMRMSYIGLISVVVAVTNLIPNFGPVIGGVIGAFILLLVNPLHALIFIGLCVVLQVVDGYVLRPKLFSNSLGVSGVVILAATIVLGNMFGIIGILLAIPVAAVLHFVYNDYFIPWRKSRKALRESHPDM